MRRYPSPVEALSRQNDLIMTAALANTLARLAASLEDAAICDEALLLELLALADRAEDALRPLQ